MICIEPRTLADQVARDARSITRRFGNYIVASEFKTADALGWPAVNRIEASRKRRLLEEHSKSWCRLETLAPLPCGELAKEWKPS